MDFALLLQKVSGGLLQTNPDKKIRARALTAIEIGQADVFAVCLEKRPTLTDDAKVFSAIARHASKDIIALFVRYARDPNPIVQQDEFSLTPGHPFRIGVSFVPLLSRLLARGESEGAALLLASENVDVMTTGYIEIQRENACLRQPYRSPFQIAEGYKGSPEKEAAMQALLPRLGLRLAEAYRQKADELDARFRAQLAWQQHKKQPPALDGPR
jgi:hypothetical protein